jgi:hypothetical protein
MDTMKWAHVRGLRADNTLHEKFYITQIIIIQWGPWQNKRIAPLPYRVLECYRVLVVSCGVWDKIKE